MKIKIKIQNKFYFWLKSKIEKKKSIEQKAKKKIKKIGTKLKKQICENWMMKLKINKTSTKGQEQK
jgi:hypothetical protein